MENLTDYLFPCTELVQCDAQGNGADVDQDQPPPSRPLPCQRGGQQLGSFLQDFQLSIWLQNEPNSQMRCVVTHIYHYFFYIISLLNKQT